jgi:hypothetical protein
LGEIPSEIAIMRIAAHRLRIMLEKQPIMLLLLAQFVRRDLWRMLVMLLHRPIPALHGKRLPLCEPTLPTIGQAKANTSWTPAPHIPKAGH